MKSSLIFGTLLISVFISCANSHVPMGLPILRPLTVFKAVPVFNRLIQRFVHKVPVYRTVYKTIPVHKPVRVEVPVDRPVPYPVHVPVPVAHPVPVNHIVEKPVVVDSGVNTLIVSDADSVRIGDQGFGNGFDMGGGMGRGRNLFINDADHVGIGEQGFSIGDQGFNTGDQGFNTGDQGFNTGDQGFGGGISIGGVNGRSIFINDADHGDQGFGGRTSIGGGFGMNRNLFINDADHVDISGPGFSTGGQGFNHGSRTGGGTGRRNLFINDADHVDISGPGFSTGGQGLNHGSRTGGGTGRRNLFISDADQVDIFGVDNGANVAVMGVDNGAGMEHNFGRDNGHRMDSSLGFDNGFDMSRGVDMNNGHGHNDGFVSNVGSLGPILGAADTGHDAEFNRHIFVRSGSQQAQVPALPLAQEIRSLNLVESEFGRNDININRGGSTGQISLINNMKAVQPATVLVGESPIAIQDGRHLKTVNMAMRSHTNTVDVLPKANPSMSMAKASVTSKVLTKVAVPVIPNVTSISTKSVKIAPRAVVKV